MGEPELERFATADALATEVAARLLVALAAAQQSRTHAALALTAGSIMERVWAAIVAAPDAGSVDWAAVEVFWGDERYVPHDSQDRNDLPAERGWFATQPFSAARRHSMPASDGPYGDDLDAAARAYAETLRNACRPDDPGDLPRFDVVLLGVGPDGHCCSLFPGHPGTRDDSGPVIAVRDSPKPPPDRLSFSFAGLNEAEQIWVVASGSGKADAVAAALGGADRESVPSAGARGRSRTVWLVDADAAAALPDHGAA